MFVTVMGGVVFIVATLIAYVAGRRGVGGVPWWNASPAKIFMGDTGAMAIGGLVTALGLERGDPPKPVIYERDRLGFRDTEPLP